VGNQLQILGDLQQEFASAPEKGEELFLVELGSPLGSGFSGALGKYSTGLISRLIKAKCLVVSIRRLSWPISARAGG
jgi:fatty acid synthase subunit beta